MGADLYIEYEGKENPKDRYNELFLEACMARDSEKNEADRKDLQKTVEKYHDLMYPETHYFRDSYNYSSLLWQIGLSWWEDIGDKLDEDGCLPKKEIRWLLNEIKNAEIKKPTKEELEKNYASEDNAEDWYNYFLEKRVRFIKFLQCALREDAKLVCSI